MSQCEDCKLHNVMEFRVDRIESGFNKHEKIITDTSQRVIKIEENLNTANDKLDDYLETSRAIVSLLYEVKTYNEKMDSVISQQAEILKVLAVHDERFNELEHKPADKLYNTVESIKSNWLSAVVGGSVAFLSSFIFDKLK